MDSCAKNRTCSGHLWSSRVLRSQFSAKCHLHWLAQVFAGKSNTGEGGEDPMRFAQLEAGPYQAGAATWDIAPGRP
eukprot:6490880-Amphidinium_carterae.4